ncbi:MAG: hypothetical protein FD180_3237 [Planctomycetota bacterium]|nr:MAG: hypothetical protein FD180_3237 [Planctomycetota bacterium]
MTVARVGGCRIAALRPPPDRIARITVTAVQPLFGGWSLWIRADGAAAAFRVSRGCALSTRHDAKVSEPVLRRIEAMLAETKFWDLPPPTLKSAPMPDETWIEVSAKTQSGNQASVGKFARQKSERFDPILKELEGIAAQAWAGQKVSEGKYDAGEIPQGF